MFGRVWPDVALCSSGYKESVTLPSVKIRRVHQRVPVTSSWLCLVQSRSRDGVQAKLLARRMFSSFFVYFTYTLIILSRA